MTADAPLVKKICGKCAGNGMYKYDHNHSKPCEQCCDHSEGWWELTPHHAGYREGEDNLCCKKGCGMLHRELDTSMP